MTPKRTIVVIAAVAVGVLAATLSYTYLNGAQQRAYHNAHLVPAYVVAKPIPPALTGADAVDQGYIAHKNVPAEFRPYSAVTDLSSLQGKQAVSSYAVGQVVVTSMFASPAAVAVANSFAQSIPAGDVAVTVSVDQTHGVAGLAVPGDRVDLLVSDGTTESSLLQNVPILAIGQQTVSQASTASTTASTSSPSNDPSSGLITFAVQPADAARIALAQQQNMGIYLLLVPPNNPVATIPQVDAGSILNGPQTSS
ncbi:MAG TPA: Flp pilus assembly protein CpaB [Acidimicrobiales bacterium]|nr:Flp pilus assembly protein CpaB [Acidimicrobiales bacterium]